MSQSMEFLFRRRYNLAPTDPRFLDATHEDIVTDYWAHHYLANPSEEEIEDEDFDMEAYLREAEEEAEGEDDFEDVDLKGDQ